MFRLAQPLAQFAFALLVSGAAVSCTRELPRSDAGMAGAAGAPSDAGDARDAFAKDSAPPPGSGTCGPDTAAPEAALSWTLTGDWPPAGADRRQRFAGLAAVERSTSRDLVLYAQPSSASQADTGASAAHCVIESSNELPVLRVGTQLWLEFSVDRDYGGPPRPRDGDQLALRTKADGTLLFAGIEGRYVEPDGLKQAGFGFRAPEEVCRNADPFCSEEVVLSYSLEVRADDAQRIRPGARATLALTGNAYDIWLLRARAAHGPMGQCALDYVPDESLQIQAEVHALDAARATAELPRAALPECALGNDPGIAARSWIADRNFADAVESEVKYRGLEDGNLVFEFVDDAESGTFQISNSAAFAEPNAGQTFWLSSTLWFFVLRETKTGPIALASGKIDTVEKGVASWVGGKAADRVSAWLGAQIAFEPLCLYEITLNTAGKRDEKFLYGMRIGTDPTTLVRSGTRGRVAISGVTYEVWMSSTDQFLSFTVTPAN